jgi:two-component system phosphate regulon sensor histidine kinase PhoR
MTHEFKTPVSTIVVTTDLLKKPEIYKDYNQISHYADVIKKEGLRLRDQVEKILYSAQYESREVQLEKSLVDISDSIHEAVNGCMMILQQKMGEIKLNLLATNTVIHADQFHMTGCIFNLLDNAIKYCTKAPIIELSTENVPNGIELRITDNGIGISKNYQKKIFNKFYRVPTGNVHNVKGFGIGLYYVKSIIKAHNGTITVESNLEKGSTFKIFLPHI